MASSALHDSRHTSVDAKVVGVHDIVEIVSMSSINILCAQIREAERTRFMSCRFRARELFFKSATNVNFDDMYVSKTPICVTFLRGIAGLFARFMHQCLIFHLHCVNKSSQRVKIESKLRSEYAGLTTKDPAAENEDDGHFLVAHIRNIPLNITDVCT